MRRLIIISFFLLTCVVASGQRTIDFSNYYGEDVLPELAPAEYVHMPFEWKMTAEVQKAMNSGLTSLDEENYGGAVEHFKDVVKLSPAFVPGQYYLGVALCATYEFEEAEKILRHAATLDKYRWEIPLQLGSTLFFQGKLNEAEKQYEKAIELNNTKPEPHFRLGYLEVRRSLANPRFDMYYQPLPPDFKKAFRQYEKATEVDPSFAKAYVMQGLIKMPKMIRNSSALTYFNKALSYDSLNTAALFWRGLYYIYQNKPSTALMDWNKLVDTNPNISRFVLYRGFLNIELEDYSQAFTDLRKGVLFYEADAESFQGTQSKLDKRIDTQAATRYAMRNAYGLQEETFDLFKKGYCLFLAQRYDDAITELRKAEQKEKAAVISFSLGIAHEQSGKHPEAFQYYVQSIALDPDNFDAYKKCSIYRTELRDWRGALKDLSNMQRLEPSSKITHKLRGLMKMSAKEFNGAIVDLTEYIKLDSMDAEAFLNRGYCHAQSQSPKNAGADYFRSLQLDSTNHTLYEFTASHFLENKDTLKALEVRKMHVKLFDKGITNLVDLASLELAMNRTADAHLHIQSALERLGENSLNTTLLARAMHLQGLIYYRLAVYKASIKPLTKAKELQPALFEAQYYRGKSYLQLGDKRNAIKDFEALANAGYMDSAELVKSLRNR